MEGVRRRRFLIAAGAVFAAPLVRARAATKLPVLGMLLPGPKDAPKAQTAFRALFLKRLRELGWVEGKTLRIERAYSGKNLDRLPEAAAMLVKKGVDVIWAPSPLGAVAAARATSTIPIVFWRVGFPDRLGLIDSYARPGRNVTGLAWVDVDLYIKRYQLLREIAPHAVRVAALASAPGKALPTVSGGFLDMKWFIDEVNAEKRALGFEPKTVFVRKVADFDGAFAAIEKWGADSLMVYETPHTMLATKQIIDFARRRRLIDMYEAREWAAAGGLISYGIVAASTLLRSAEMIDRILRGAKPADMPVEMPSHFELVVNQAVAKTQGFTFPQSVLLRADQVIG
jgi:putative ABC transport system substrate-binding protein